MQASERPGSEIDNGWPAYRHMVLSALERLDERDRRLDEKLEKIIRNQDAIRIDLAGLMVKSSTWGAIAGLIPVVIALIFFLFGHGGG